MPGVCGGFWWELWGIQCPHRAPKTGTMQRLPKIGGQASERREKGVW